MEELKQLNIGDRICYRDSQRPDLEWEGVVVSNFVSQRIVSILPDGVLYKSLYSLRGPDQHINLEYQYIELLKVHSDLLSNAYKKLNYDLFVPRAPWNNKIDNETNIL